MGDLDARLPDPGFDTLALHAGDQPDPPPGARAVPIHLTTSFVFESSDQAAALFNMERPGHVYSRISNPTNAVLEQRVAALEGGVGAIATASGGALHLAIAADGRGRAYRRQHGAVWRLAEPVELHAAPLRHRHHLCPTWRPGRLARAIRPNTRLLFGETVGNPGLEVLDIPTVAQIAHEAGVPLLVDSTSPALALLKPFEHGRRPGLPLGHQIPPGHGTVMAACWSMAAAFRLGKNRDKFAPQPYDGFHGMVFTRKAPWAPFCCAPGAARVARLWRLHEPAHRLADPQA